MTAPLNIVFYCSFRFYRDSFAEPFSEFPLPAIAHVVVDGALLHYVVIHKITQKQVVVADPAKGIVKYTPEEFFKQWTGILILLVPSERFEKGDERG